MIENKSHNSQLTDLIKDTIAEQYKNIHQFSATINIPYTTLVSALKNGIGGTGFQTVLTICNALKIKNTKNSLPLLVEPQKLLDIDKLLKLDEQGIKNTLRLLELEYKRCIDEYNE